MFEHRTIHLESWTRDKLAEMRHMAAIEAQLRSRRPQTTSHRTWLQKAAGQLGSTLVVVGRRLQQAGSYQAQASQ